MSKPLDFSEVRPKVLYSQDNYHFEEYSEFYCLMNRDGEFEDIISAYMKMNYTEEAALEDAKLKIAARQAEQPGKPQNMSS